MCRPPSAFRRHRVLSTGSATFCRLVSWSPFVCAPPRFFVLPLPLTIAGEGVGCGEAPVDWRVLLRVVTIVGAGSPERGRLNRISVAVELIKATPSFPPSLPPCRQRNWDNGRTPSQSFTSSQNELTLAGPIGQCPRGPHRALIPARPRPDLAKTPLKKAWARSHGTLQCLADHR